MKDYYTTLEVAPAATDLQIKKSFRKLALQHHPDKNPGNAFAEARFKEIQEAYEVLSDPEKREEYNYKRWYSRSIKKDFTNEPLTPSAILAECNRLNDYMLTINTLGVDYDGLSYHIRQLLSDKNTNILLQNADRTTIETVIDTLIHSSNILPFRYTEPISVLLLRLANGNTLMENRINNFVKKQKRQSVWIKYRTIVVIAITILLCMVIYFISR